MINEELSALTGRYDEDLLRLELDIPDAERWFKATEYAFAHMFMGRLDDLTAQLRDIEYQLEKIRENLE